MTRDSLFAGSKKRREVITRNSPSQPFFYQPIDEPGFVAFRWKGHDYLVSAAKAEELLGELKEACRIARKS